jgi:hypothetical protein
VWGHVERLFLERDAPLRAELLERLQPAAHLQPARIIALARLALDHPAPPSPLDRVFSDVDLGDGLVRERLPALLRRVGASPEHLEDALTILWRLARDHGGPPSPLGPVDPISAIQELSGYGAGAGAADAVIDLVEALLAGPDAAAPRSPLDLLRRLVDREGTLMVAEGLGFRPMAFHVNAEAVVDTRSRLFAVLTRQARDGTVRNRMVAARLLDRALQQPRGTTGQLTPSDAFDSWRPEQVELLDRIAELVGNERVAPLVRSTLRTAVLWHAEHGAWAEARSARWATISRPGRAVVVGRRWSSRARADAAGARRPRGPLLRGTATACSTR